ncbi:hypothetical protein [Mucilaginibacter sp. L3T2-6]|uniref:hypothetical protein n=1 Tax=Mucilaginibacter sp. L3T2-6 TaxID=3062491 RepID=UPI0026767B0E|nr:hypothetical protein [Mucilaginibacter sp. L3T2-6]MDO3645316.1 hypothetical protein [Mucilaginibacter sp. L3T2-6]MDV6217815.1 hypothetical protein [Mucilaginibacter sp. L3T2-6]
MEQQYIEPKRIRKWPFYLLGIVVLLAGTAYYFYNKYLASNRWKPILQAQLKELVLKSTDSLYHIEYSDFDLNITSGNAAVMNFKLMPDTDIYNKLVALKKAPDNLFILNVKKLSIKNVGARKAYQEKILNIDDITIDKPNLTIINKRFKFNDTVKVGKSKTPYEVISKVFKQLHIDSVSLNDISLNYINKNKPVDKHIALKHLDIHISDVVIDSLSDKSPDRFYYTKGIDVTVHDYDVFTPDGMYKASLKKIFFSTAQRKIILDKVAFTPRYNHDDFYKKTGKAGDIFNLKFKQIDINDIDLQTFLRDQVLWAGTMNVSSPDVKIYSNNAFKGKKTSKIGKDPHQALQNVALDMKLKRLNIKNGNISYSETDAATQQTGEITFKHTNGYFLNVTNDDDQKKINPYMRAVINTSFMGEAPLNVNFRFNLRARDGAFNYSGALGRFDGRKLDKLVKPLAMVHVESADIDKLAFNINASNYSGKGKVEFYYKNLKIDLLKKVDGQAELQRQGLISTLANKLILDSSNPDSKGVFRPGPVDLKREPTVSFFSFLYKGILDGLKPSVGFDSKTEGKVNRAVAKVDSVVTKVNGLLDKFRKFKEDRKARREARKAAKQAKKDSLEKAKLNNGN